MKNDPGRTNIKKLVLPFLLLLVFNCQAQDIEKYYNYKWEVCEPNAARFISIISKTDTCYRRSDYFIHERKLQMSGLYEDAECKIGNGHFAYYSSNGFVKSFGDYKHGKKEGIWLGYHANRVMSDSSFYVHGHKSGVSFSWYRNGYLRDSVVTNADGSGVEVSWFDTGVLSSAGRYAAGRKKTGRWMYYHNNAKLSSLEVFHEDSLFAKNYFDEQGTANNDTSSNDRIAEFPGGINAWTKYVNDKIYFPQQFKIVTGDKAVVVVNFTVNTDGNVEDIIVTTPFYPAFDKIVTEVIQKSPRWLPAIENNRKVNCNFSLPVTFAQP